MNDQTRTWRQALPGPRALVTIASAGLLVLLAAIVGAVAFDVPINDIVNDPMYTLDGPPLTGAVSDLGVVLWWAGAVIALFRGFLLGHRSGRTQASRFLLVGGLIAAYLTSTTCSCSTRRC